MSFKATSSKTRPERMKPVPTPDLPNVSTSSRRSSISSTSSSDSFHSAQHSPSHDHDPEPTPPPTALRFSPSQEALHISASNDLKTAANTQFSSGDYSSALSTYDRAIAELPTYLDYELAVLQSNIAACHIRLEEWKDAVKAAEKGWESLESIEPTAKPKKQKDDKAKAEGENGSGVVELPEDNDDEENEAMLKRLDLSDQRRSDVRRIRTKILLRRARARYMLGTTPPKPVNKEKEDKNPFAQASNLTSDSAGLGSSWSNLSAALADYQMLSQKEYFSTLPASDQKTVRNALMVLPGSVEKAKENEVAEMMGKLKELGNGILKPFGLSTDMFKMEKDPVSGGMSLSFGGNKDSNGSGSEKK